MNPIIVSFDSVDFPNAKDLFDYQPEDPEMFGFPLNFSIGVEGERGADNFQVMVATPKYIQEMHLGQSAVLLRHFIIVFRYDFHKILDLVNNYVRSLNEDSWEKIAEKLSRVALWEFEDYRPYQP